MAELHDFAGVIVMTPDNGVVLQVRDDNPAIKDPGKLSLFAGRMEQGETPIQAAVRELAEETTVAAQEGQLEFVMAYPKNPERHGGTETCHIYILRDVDQASIHIQEGQGYRVVYDPSEVTEENCALISYDILQEYYRRYPVKPA